MRKTVLVTGATGFLGSHVITELENHPKFLVTGTFHPDDPPSGAEPLQGGATEDKKRITRFVPIDLTDYKKTSNLVRKFDYVIHLAALVQGTGRYDDAPATVIAENFIIDNNVFRAAAKHKVKRVIYMSSHETLRHLNYKRVDERVLEQNLMPAPTNAYAFSKFVGDRLLREYHREAGLEYVIFYNMSYDYGVLPTPKSRLGYQPRIIGEDSLKKRPKSGWIPLYIEIVKRMLDKKTPLVIRGDPKLKRYWTDLRDTARALVLALDAKQAANQTFFISSEESLTLEQFARIFFERIRAGERFNPSYVESTRLPSLYHIPDTQKTRKLLGWEAQYKLSDSVDAIVNWVKNEFPR